MFTRLAAAVVAVSLGLALSLVGASAAQAHTGTLGVTSACQADGTYLLTYSGSTTSVPDEGTGHIATLTVGEIEPSGTVVTGAPATVVGNTGYSWTETVPGTTKYAQSTAFLAWGDGASADPQGTITLAGTCEQVPTKDSSIGVTPLTPSCGTTTVYTDAQFSIGNATWNSAIDNTAGTHTRTATSTAHHTFADGTTSANVSYTVSSGPANQSTNASAPCFVLPDAVKCVVTNSVWTTEQGDVEPLKTAAGFTFSGPHAKAVDTYQRATGNLQGITGISYTLAPGTTGQPAQVVIEVDPHAVLNPGGPVVDYATISTNLPAGTSGTIDASGLPGGVSGLSGWTTTKIQSGPGSLSQPLTYAQLVNLMPQNTLLSAPSLHLLTNSTSGDTSTVSAISSSCGPTDFTFNPSVCEGNTTLTPVTAENPGTWGDLKNATFVDGGLQLDATATEEAYGYTDFPAVSLTQMGNLKIETATPNQVGVILQEANGDSIHYDSDGRYWSIHPGIFPETSPGFYSTYNLSELQSNPMIVEYAVWVNPGDHALVTAVHYNCQTQPFGGSMGEVGASATPRAVGTDPVCVGEGSTAQLTSGFITVSTTGVTYVITNDATGAVISYDSETGETGAIAAGNYTARPTAKPTFELSDSRDIRVVITAFDGTCGPQLPTDATVIPSATFVQLGCTTSGSYTLTSDQPAADAVTWTVNGSLVSRGTYTVSAPGHYVVDATPGPTYGFTEDTQTEWIFDFATPTTCSLATLALTGGTPTGLLVLAGFVTLFGLALVRRARNVRTAA